MLSWHLPDDAAKKWGLRSAAVYVSARNILTMTKFPVSDPETQNPTVVPPMKAIVAGLHVNF